MTRALLFLVVLGAVGAGAWYVSNLAAENAAMKAQLARPGAAAPAARPAQSAASAPTGAPRTVNADQKKAILDTLATEAGAEKKIWFRVDPNDPEAAGFEKALEDAFKEAGWEASRLGNDGLMFKPGIYLLVGEEDWPTYAETANKALEAAGFTVTAARGYRAYYEQQSKEKPGWRGAKFLPDQTYVVLIGRKPEA
jgi:hypothetical protein